MEELNTSFAAIYDYFYQRITDDLYLELTEFDTFRMLQDLLIAGLHRFEFPRFDLYDYEIGEIEEFTYQGVESDGEEVPGLKWVGGTFNFALTDEERNILAMLMVVEWFGQQLATTENTREKFSGSDFKFSSQANHMKTLRLLKENANKEAFHAQRLYKRRKRSGNGMLSTMGQIMETPSYGYLIQE